MTARHPWPRSFLRRQGHVTRAQKRALREHWSDWGLDLAYGVELDLDRAFGFDGPAVLDVGFGHGETLVALAEQRPEWRVLGVEVHRPGLGAALQQIAAAKLTNVRVIRGDVLTVLHDHLARGALDEVFVCFPEPWPRPHDAKRRLVRPVFVDAVERAMAGGGALNVVTDVAEYAEHCRAVLGRSGWSETVMRWRTAASWDGRRAAIVGHGNGDGRGHGSQEAAEWRPVTHYEKRALEAGRVVRELRFEWEPATAASIR